VRRGWHAERALRSVAATLLLAMSGLIVRALHATLDPQAYVDAAGTDVVHGLSFLLAFLAVLAGGFGFAMAVFERVAGQLEELATHDGLTGCLNRSTTDALLAHELQRGRRLGTPVAFVLLDLDRFKRINDRYGHRVGDAVLREFARTVRERLRESDVLGRTGGEEFGLVLPGTDASGAHRLVDDIRKAVQAAEVSTEAGERVRVTVSAGVAVAGPAESDIDAERLYGHADKALYAAKRSGRNRIALYSSDQAALATP
jgi:diguanylate cyclase (GGDEF)-like protein